MSIIKKGLSLVFNIWCIFWFIGIFLILFPFIYFCIQIQSLKKYGTKITNFWADLFFIITFMPVKIEYKFKPDNKKAYVFVANHFSYIDVAIGMKVVRNYFSYMGKSSVKKIPLLGYMFAKLHIQVDRSDKNSRANSLLRSKKALLEGRSLFIMPEGGIVSEKIPKMHLPLKDGAFLLAIDAQVPIVPLVFLNMYEVMPSTTLVWRRPRVLVHNQIETKGLDKSHLEELKNKVYHVIQNELDDYYSKK